MVLNEKELISERYEVIKKIGSGGMAIVYKALDTKLNRQVTLKVMREEFAHDEDFIRRFQKEAHAAAGISHQNIVNIYDVGSEGYLHYIVMEYIDGHTLKELIRRKAPFKNEETLGVAIQIATALEHAHNNNVIHRDIKPQNILITSDGTVKVTDFGIARVTSDATQTATSKAMGSVHYFSPEQARGGYTDHGSDIYSLGIVMFEMATGKIPFDGDTPVAIALKHINDEMPDIKNLNPVASESIIRIIAKATQKMTVKRYRSMESMGNDLKRALTNSTGDFVAPPEYEEEPETAKSSTIILSDDEEARIKREAKSIFFDESGEEFESEDIYEDEYEEYDEQEEQTEYDEDEYSDDEGEYDEEYEEEKDDEPNSETDTEEEKYNKKQERKIIAAAIATSLIIIAFSVFMLWRVFFPQNGSQNSEVMVEVPDVVGEDIDVAVEKYKNLNIGFYVDARQYSEEYPAGIILEQLTPAGGQMYENGLIHVIISNGADLVEIPDFTGWTKEDINALYASGVQPFNLHITTENHETVPMGTITRQEPEPGELAKPGDIITVYESIGPAIVEVTVPSIIGQTEAAAQTMLIEAGLTVGSVTSAPSSVVEAGLVVTQSVEQGRTLPAGSPVGFRLSSGPSAVTQQTDDSPPPLQTETTPPAKKQILVFALANPPEGVEMIEYRIVKYELDSEASEVVERDIIPVTEFPISVEVSGTGQAEYLFSIYQDGAWKLQEKSPVVDFDNL